jgi:hypothetical protein
VEAKVSAYICAEAHCCFPAYRNISKSFHKGWMGSQSIRHPLLFEMIRMKTKWSELGRRLTQPWKKVGEDEDIMLPRVGKIRNDWPYFLKYLLNQNININSNLVHVYKLSKQSGTIFEKPKYYPIKRSLHMQTLAHIWNLCAIAGSQKTTKQKAQTIQPRYPQTRQRRAIAQQSPATANKGKTYEKVCGMWQQIPTILFKAIMTTRKGLQNLMQNTDTRIHTKIHH